MKQHLRLFILFLLLPLLAALVPFASPSGAAAQSGQPDPLASASPTTTGDPGGLQLIGVQPNVISNETAVELVVTGAGFASGAVLVLDGSGALETIFVSANLLRAVVPAGIPPRVYSLTAINPDAASTTLANALTVTAPAATPGPSATPAPTNTPAPTAFVRPLLVVSSYGASSAEIVPGSNLDFEMTVANAGQLAATNVVATFISGDFTARDTGGVRALGALAPGATNRFWQPLAAGGGLAGQRLATLQVKVDYTDANGTAYSETFSLTFPVKPAGGGGPAPTATATPTATPTSTPAPRLRAQLIITGYEIDVAQLEPGTPFELTVRVQNQGSAAAQRVTMILGGGSSSGGVNAEGTPQPGGGLAGASGSFTEFAPVGASNVQSLGDLAVGRELVVRQQLIVNAATRPGAYPLKVSFVYGGEGDVSLVDDQVITLLVYRRPVVAFTFYAPAPFVTAGEPAPLPLQLVNTGSTSAVLGTFRVDAAGATLENNSIFIGALEPGGSYPLDALLIAGAPGTLTLELSVGYVDDFSRAQVITGTLQVEVIEAPIFVEPEFPDGGEQPPVEAAPETTWQAFLRLVRGLLGLSSGRAEQNAGGSFGAPGGEFGPVEEVPFGP